jgi:tetratricopeptide (TPR) repeat protein
MRIVRLGACALLGSVSLSLAVGQTGTRLGTDTEAPPPRLAMLVGNSNYKNLNPLKNPKNDVDKLAARLQQLGFQTFPAYDLDHDHFVDALEAFRLKIPPGAVVLFYYSGHGAQLGGANYLIPVNMPSGASATTVQGYGISLQQVREIFNAARLNLIVLDACRTVVNLPAKGPSEGLAPFFSRGSLVAYAADEGQSASDNDSENLSLFTKYLIVELDKHDENLCQLFERVRMAVDDASGHVQFPFVYDGVIGDFIFNRTNTEESRKLSSVSSTVGRNKVWQTIEVSDNPNDFAAFLALSPPDKKHAKEAEDRLSSLMSSTIGAAGVVPVDAQEAPPEVVAMANQGERLFYEGAYGKALKLYKNLLASRPSDSAIVYDYATCLLYLGHRETAIEYFTKANELNPVFPWAIYNRGVAYQLGGFLSNAVKDYEKTIKERPDYAVAYNNLALAQRDLSERDPANLKNAADDAKRATEKDPYYAPAFFNNARILKDVGNLSAAASSQDKGKQLTIPAIF